MNHCFIIAEAGVNHNGSAELALKLVDAAAEAGADAVKFQTFKADKLVTKYAATAEYQKKHTGSDDQYTMLKSLELSDDFHKVLFEHCKRKDIEFISTPFDKDAADFLVGLGMEKLKVPSGELTNIPLIEHFAAYNKPIILSTGMADLGEVREAVNAVQAIRDQKGFKEPLADKLTILHCTSNYPTRNEDVNLKAIQTIACEFALPVGYSDHTKGTLISVASVAMGATVVEKHFTLDKNLSGPDHQSSLEPDELASMVKQIRQVSTCLGDGIKVPRANELPIRELVRRSVVLARDMKLGDTLQPDDLVLLRPGTGIPPKDLATLLGRKLKASKCAGELLSWDDLAL
ncbi:N-acetylneuraminate synthase [Neptunomonas sp.]|uniref:N-acetylneuraminate synthase n=1 Tax=Neptunomonas sp. TaxID=1971898 RepID=UPI00356B4A9A